MTFKEAVEWFIANTDVKPDARELMNTRPGEAQLRECVAKAAANGRDRGTAEGAAAVIRAHWDDVDYGKSLGGKSDDGETFSWYSPGDAVVATCDFTEGHEHVHAGDRDVVESVSSNHHGGLQLNLRGHGRGWSNHVWRKP